ncbi:MAG TPA: hypothetical protein IGS17_08335, partial [Oscillatoriales cyanobacterium M59_W2019_021]|nr:hypothetical protein [Oscillatoriales cyanobacterium M59_W2019_021]
MRHLTRTFSPRAIAASAILGAMAWGSIAPNAIAQVGECLPPQAGEYLILVIAAQEKEQEATLDLLPSDSPASVCNYLGEIVVRIGGYRDIEEANTWAQSLAAQTGLGAFVTRPPQVTAETPVVPAEPTPEPMASSPTSASSSSSLPLPNVRVIPAQQVGNRSRAIERSTPEVVEAEPETGEARQEPMEIRANDDRQSYVPDLGLSPGLEELPDYNVLPPVTASPANTPSYPVTPSYNSPPPLPAPSGALPALPNPKLGYTPPATPVQPLPVAYNPQRLEEGYAVLVDYFDRPEIAV